MPDYRHILLIKPSSLGDIVHAMPTCAAIRRAYPKARLTWLVKREWAGLVERIDGVDRVWPVESTLTGWLSQVSALRAERFDLVVDPLYETSPLTFDQPGQPSFGIGSTNRRTGRHSMHDVTQRTRLDQ